MPVKLSADHIAAQAGGFEPQRNNHWSVRITGLADPNVIELSLKTFDPPKRNIDPITIEYGNEDRKVAGRVTYDNASLAVRDYVDAKTWKTLWDWQETVHNSGTGAIGFASAYKKEGTLYLYAPDGTKERRWRAVGLWPSNITSASWDQSGNEANELTCDLVCDKLFADQLTAA
jgi:hypothetical protein